MIASGYCANFTQNDRLREEMRRAIEAELVKQRALRLEMEQERVEIEARESRELQTKYRDLVGAVVRARADLAQLEIQLKRNNPDPEFLRQAEQSIDAAAHVIAMGSPVSAIAQAKNISASQWRQPRLDEVGVGIKVNVPKWGASAEIVDVTAKGEVRVVAGALRAWLPLHELRVASGGFVARRPKGPAQSLPPRTGNKMPAAPPRRVTPVRIDSNTLDLRGARVDEALDQVDAFVDKMLRAGQRAAFVLHGHGTGALKQAVRNHLSLSLQVSDSAPADPEDGGDAFTVFWLGG